MNRTELLILQRGMVTNLKTNNSSEGIQFYLSLFLVGSLFQDH